MSEIRNNRRFADTLQGLAYLLLLFIPLATYAGVGEREVNEALKRLDNELKLRHNYIVARKSGVDSLKNALVSSRETAERLNIILALGDTYKAINIDSALWFYRHGHSESANAGEITETARFALREATFLPLSGFFPEAEKMLDSVKSVGLNPDMEAEYLDALRQSAFYMSTFFADYPTVSQAYLQKSLHAQNELIDKLPPESPRFKLNSGEALFYNRQYKTARTCLENLITEIPETDPLYARACHILADIAKIEGDTKTYTYYLSLSAIADVRSATLEVASLQELGNLLFLNGDTERAHRYMNVALENAVECDAPLRMIEASRMLPFIQKAHSISEERSKRLLRWSLIIALITVCVAGVAIVRVRIKQKQLQEMALRLADTGKLKDSYISQFLKLCSIYMEKLTSFNRMVHRKLTAGKTDDLLKLTKNGKMVEELSTEFYDVLDDALLNLYPSFVSDVNALLMPDEHIILKEGERLNVELRILALMRLGVSDATHIARMLNYSVNTIYTYRNKLKNRAADRDRFEEQVMAIK